MLKVIQFWSRSNRILKQVYNVLPAYSIKLNTNGHHKYFATSKPNYRRYEKRNNHRSFSTFNILASALAVVYCESDLQIRKEKRFLKAAQYGLTHEVNSLIKSGVDLNVRHSLGWTPLMVAAANEQYDIVKSLLENGADPNLGENFVNVNKTAQEKGLHPIEGKNNYLYYPRLLINAEIR